MRFLRTAEMKGHILDLEPLDALRQLCDVAGQANGRPGAVTAAEVKSILFRRVAAVEDDKA